MIPYLCWIVAIYVVAAAMVHIANRISTRGNDSESTPIKYVLVTHNHGNQVEWYVRALIWYSRLRALPIQIVIWDAKSNDDTLPILHKLRNQEGLELNITGLPDHSERDIERIKNKKDDDNTTIFLDLRVPKEAAKLPYVHI